MEFQTLKVALVGQVATIELNRPERANALELGMWTELRDAMRWLDETAAARVGVISGAGKHFTAGIDLDMLGGHAGADHGRLRRPLAREAAARDPRSAGYAHIRSSAAASR